MLRAAAVLALSVGCLHAAAADSFNTQVRRNGIAAQGCKVVTCRRRRRLKAAPC
jgi:hypothetical protein